MRIHLRGLVLALTVFSAIAATANALYASYCVQRDQLIANTQSNRVYAAKLAERGQLPEGRAAATALQRPARGRRLDSPAALEAEASRCRNRATASIPWASSARTASSWRPRETFAAFSARASTARAGPRSSAPGADQPALCVDRRQSADHAVARSTPRWPLSLAISQVRSTCATRAPCRNCWAATITRMALSVRGGPGRQADLPRRSQPLGEDVAQSVVAAVKQGESGARRC